RPEAASERAHRRLPEMRAGLRANDAVPSNTISQPAGEKGRRRSRDHRGHSLSVKSRASVRALPFQAATSSRAHFVKFVPKHYGKQSLPRRCGDGRGDYSSSWRRGIEGIVGFEIPANAVEDTAQPGSPAEARACLEL